MIRPGSAGVYLIEMSVSLRAESYEIELHCWYEAGRGGNRPISDFTGALDLVSRLWMDPESRAQLREIAWSARGLHGAQDDALVREQIAAMICDGALQITTRERPPVSFQAPPQQPLVELADDIEPLVPSVQDEPEPNWITFEILDDEGKPASGVRLRLVGPDGAAQELTTDSRGEVHLPDVPQGAFDLEWIESEDPLEVIAVA